MGWHQRAGLVVLVLALVLGVSAPAHAQAVVDEPGSLTATLTQEYGFADSIVETDGKKFPSVYVNTLRTRLGLEYVPMARLAVSVSLPLVGNVYDKDKSGALYDPHGPYDDGSRHWTLTDFEGDVRYEVLESPLALAFNLGFVLPVRNYPVQGSAAPGRHLKQGQIGIAVSYAPEALPRLFTNASYELTLSEKFDETSDTEKFGQTRSDATLQIGYFVLDKLAVYGLLAWRYQHDGVDFVDFDMLTPSQQAFHDPILRESGLVAGPGAQYMINEKLFASVNYVHFVTGQNTLTMNLLSVTLGWSIR